MTYVKDKNGDRCNTFGMLTRMGRKIGCSNCWARARAEWSVLDRAEIAVLDRARRPCVYLPGETIFHQGEEPQGVYCVESGHILLSRIDNFGNQTVFQFAVPGETTGWRSFFAEQPHAATARALTTCRVCLIAAAAMWTLVEKNPILGMRFLRTLARDRGPADALLLRNPQLPVRIRIVYLLLVLSESCAKPLAGGGIVVEIPFGRQDIAAMVSARAETVSRAIAELRDEGAAKFRGRQVIVPNLDRLLEIVGENATASP